MRPAFSLAELIVVLGVLVLMLSLAGQVMNLTVRASGQATAFTETMQGVREMERTLREDLRHVVRRRSVMVIQGNPINAYFTQEGREADNDGKPETGYPAARHPDREMPSDRTRLLPPRADILMFFTQRPATTYMTYQLPGELPRQIPSRLQQVVYGHAQFGDYVRDPTGTAPYAFLLGPDLFPKYSAVAPSEASQWHLARRVVHLQSVPPPAGMKPPWADYSSQRLDDPALLRGEADVLCLTGTLAGSTLGLGLYERLVFNPGNDPITGVAPRFWPEIFDAKTIPYARSQMDPTPPAPCASRLGHYMLQNCASFKVEWAFDPAAGVAGGRLDLENGLLWIDPGALGDDEDSPTDDEPLQSLLDAQASLKLLSNQDPGLVPREQALHALLKTSQDPYDPSIVPPPGEPPVRYLLTERFGADVHGGDKAWRDPNQDERPNLHVFVANRGGAPGAPIPDPYFPIALRVTVEVYDKLLRLEQPIRHVMIIPVGEEP